jgi:hypothetical protein
VRYVPDEYVVRAAVEWSTRRMWWGIGIIGLIIWVAIAVWPARVAARKGHSFFGYFLLSLIFFPLALIMAYMVRDRRGLYVRD